MKMNSASLEDLSSNILTREAQPPSQAPSVHQESQSSRGANQVAY